MGLVDVGDIPQVKSETEDTSHPFTGMRNLN